MKQTKELPEIVQRAFEILLERIMKKDEFMRPYIEEVKEYVNGNPNCISVIRWDGSKDHELVEDLIRVVYFDYINIPSVMMPFVTIDYSAILAHMLANNNTLIKLSDTEYVYFNL